MCSSRSADPVAAEANYRGALSQFERLAQADPSNVIAAGRPPSAGKGWHGTMAPQGREAEAVPLLIAALTPTSAWRKAIPITRKRVATRHG